MHRGEKLQLEKWARGWGQTKDHLRRENSNGALLEECPGKGPISNSSTTKCLGLEMGSKNVL